MMTKTVTVNPKPMKIWRTILATESRLELHFFSGSLLNADHYKYKQYKAAMDEVNTLASFLDLVNTSPYMRSIATKVTDITQ